MNKAFLSVLLLLFTIISVAQKNSFGIVGYDVPAGYELVKSENVLTYYKENKSTGAYCNFFIYKIMTGQGGVQQDFDWAWSSLVQKPFKVTGVASMQPAATLKKWQLLLGTTNYADNGIATLAMLATFSGENTMQSVCILSNSDKYKNDIESFIASVDVVREAGVGIANAPKYDVWMCHCYTASANASEKDFKTLVLSSDGRSLYYMPEKGLNGVTPENSNQSGSWGKVTDKGNMLTLDNERYGKIELYKITPTSMSRYPNSTSSIYKKVKGVDGLRLEGAYSPELSYVNGKTDLISRQIDPNRRPILFFKKDGTYINEGIGFSNLTFGDDFAIGKGTYAIVNYSIILTTQTGRKLQVAFTPILDANPAAIDNSGLMINHNLFYRLNKTFVPHD